MTGLDYDADAIPEEESTETLPPYADKVLAYEDPSIPGRLEVLKGLYDKIKRMGPLFRDGTEYLDDILKYLDTLEREPARLMKKKGRDEKDEVIRVKDTESALSLIANCLFFEIANYVLIENEEGIPDKVRKLEGLVEKIEQMGPIIGEDFHYIENIKAIVDGVKQEKVMNNVVMAFFGIASTVFEEICEIDLENGDRKAKPKPPSNVLLFGDYRDIMEKKVIQLG